LSTVHEQVLECLKAEEAPLSLWLDVVKAYLAAGHTVHAEKMLREGTGAEVHDCTAWQSSCSICPCSTPSSHSRQQTTG
jgi:hypothetical protein